MITINDITTGTVVMFTRDLTFLGPRWDTRAMGTHFVIGGLSESGYTFSALNTRTGRMDDMMAETWVFEALRVVGRIPQEEEEECHCHE
jgi:hypothetical protein